MSRLPNVPITTLLATARWLLCVDNLTVITLRLVHKHTATDRIAAVCRFVKDEARQRTRDAVAYGVIAERPSRSASRRTARPRPAAEAPAHRARSPRQSRRAQHQTRAAPAPYGPRDSVIAALSAQASVAHAERLQQIADGQRRLRDRIAGVERQVAALTPSPITPTRSSAPIVTGRVTLPAVVRRGIARARSALRCIFGRGL